MTWTCTALDGKSAWESRNDDAVVSLTWQRNYREWLLLVRPNGRGAELSMTIVGDLDRPQVAQEAAEQELTKRAKFYAGLVGLTVGP